jgi:hypothetical protein
MTNCGCEKHNKNQETDGTCPAGQKWDATHQKCVPINGGGEGKKTEQLGDPKTQSTQGTLPEGDPGEVQMVEPSTCPEGHTWDATQQMCVPTDKKDPGDGQTQGTDKTASVESKLLARIQALETQASMNNAKAIGEKKPTAQVSPSNGSQFLSLQEIADTYVESLRNYGKYEFNIPLEYFRSITVGTADPSTGLKEAYRSMPLSIKEAYQKPNKVITEAVSISGTHATQDLDTDVAIIPGGISFVPVFQFAKVKQIEQGFDRARFFTSTIPANGSQTVGTTPTEATQTLTAIEVTPSTITGVYLIGDYDEIENSPFDLLQAIVEGSAASYDDFVATDMLTTVSAEGTLTPGLWIRADTGATITSSDVAGIVFDETGVAYGREYLENQGYLRGGIKPVLAMHPRQWRELITSTNVTSLATRSVPDIWLKAQLEEFMGVQLVVTNAVELKDNTTNDAYNAYMFVPKHSYGIAVKRDVTVKFHDYGEDNQVRVNTTWRTKTGVLDSASIVRISSSIA